MNIALAQEAHTADDLGCNTTGVQCHMVAGEHIGETILRHQHEHRTADTDQNMGTQSRFFGPHLTLQTNQAAKNTGQGDAN